MIQPASRSSEFATRRLASHDIPAVIALIEYANRLEKTISIAKRSTPDDVADLVQTMREADELIASIRLARKQLAGPAAAGLSYQERTAKLDDLLAKAREYVRF